MRASLMHVRKLSNDKEKIGALYGPQPHLMNCLEANNKVHGDVFRFSEIMVDFFHLLTFENHLQRGAKKFLLV